MPEENNRREHPDARRDEGKSCGVIQDGSIIFSVWPGTQTSAFSDLKIA